MSESPPSGVYVATSLPARKDSLRNSPIPPPSSSFITHSSLTSSPTVLPSLHSAPPNVNKSLAALDFRKELFSSFSSNQESAAYADQSWQSICVKVLPLFNGEGLRGCVEDLNDITNVWIKETPSSHIPEEINELLAAGMLTLTSKLQQPNNPPNADETLLLVARLAEIWTFFFGTVLPYLQGVFLPIKTTRSKPDVNSLDVRLLGLLAFRDYVVIPLLPVIKETFPKLPPPNGASDAEISARILQMMYVLNGVPASSGTTNADLFKTCLGEIL